MYKEISRKRKLSLGIYEVSDFRTEDSDLTLRDVLPRQVKGNGVMRIPIGILGSGSYVDSPLTVKITFRSKS